MMDPPRREAAMAALHKELAVDEAPISLVGGSAGGAAALLALAETEVPVAAVGRVDSALPRPQSLEHLRKDGARLTQVGFPDVGAQRIGP
jgi:pimeloyl-ACP methyl ester carboxylesterase